MTSTQLKFIFAAVLAFAIHGGDCAAGIIAYNSFGPSDSYDNTGNWQGAYGNQEVKLAQRFTPTASGALSQIDLGMTFAGSLNGLTTDSITLAIVANDNVDAKGKPGTSELWSHTYTDNFLSSPSGDTVANFDAAGGPFLQAGATYWLTSSTPPQSGNHLWWRSVAMHAPLALYFIQGGGVQPEGEWQTYFSENETGFAMRVTVIIPEPATAALLLAASATLLTVRRRTTCYLCQTRLADTLKAATKASTQYYFTSGAR